MTRLEDGNLYLRLRTMSHTFNAAKFEQTIIHQHVHLRRESQSRAPAHVLMRLYPIDKSLVCLQSERRTSVMLELVFYYLSAFEIWPHKIPGSWHLLREIIN